jgi:putative transposase
MFRQIADQFRDRRPRLAAFMDACEHDVLAGMDFPARHRAKLHSTNSLERLNKEVKRRADVVGRTGPCARLLPNEEAIARLIGAVLLEINDDWVIQSRYMQIEGMAELAAMPDKNDVFAIPPKAACPMATSAQQRIYTTT